MPSTRRQRHLATVTLERLFETPYQSPQLPLWEQPPDDWLTVIRVAPYAPRQLRAAFDSHQLRLFPEERATLATG
ncbi:MAG TPA: hypothetical protein VEX37_13565 [Thermomicrobiales bacterium]|nr:hypothetical protein [Thermomicrobiales bacterium]